jgi:hypothetical protein
MSGLIGDKESAKFIFFAVEDEADLPKKVDMLNHFPDCTYNVYKSWGHFKDSFDSIERLFDIKHNGLDASKSWLAPRYISHAYRINTSIEPDSFFVTKYSAALIGFYDLSHDDFTELGTLIKYWRAQIELLEVRDNSMSNPDEDAIEKLFGSYGEEAAEQLIQKMLAWQSKVKWQ